MVHKKLKGPLFLSKRVPVLENYVIENVEEI